MPSKTKQNCLWINSGTETAIYLLGNLFRKSPVGCGFKNRNQTFITVEVAALILPNIRNPFTFANANDAMSLEKVHCHWFGANFSYNNKGIVMLKHLKQNLNAFPTGLRTRMTLELSLEEKIQG